MSEQVNDARTPEPVDPWRAERARTKCANERGWLALGLGGVAWFMAGSPLPRVTLEARIDELYLSVAFGILAALGVGLGTLAVRLDRTAVVPWTALLVNVGFLILVLSRIVRWL